MKISHICLILLLVLPIGMRAQSFPSCYPTATYITHLDGEKDDASSGESAPLPAYFYSNPADTAGWTVRYEWTIASQAAPNVPFVHRFDEDISYTFSQSGTYVVKLSATFTREVRDTIWNAQDATMIDSVVVRSEVIDYDMESSGMSPFIVNIQQSKLELPNTFTPNGDGYNDVFRVKEGYQSIVEFKATVYNRWGQQLYTWSDLDGGWDGTYNGSTVKDGAYYLVVMAKGADGMEYEIRRAINVLTKSKKENGSTTTR